MKALVLDAQWDPKPGYVVSEFEKRTGKAISGNSIWRHPKLEVKQIDTPKIGPDEVLIKVMACGICGSDMHFYETDPDGYILYPGLTKFPTALGHEFSGEIVEVGKNVESVRVGDMVTVEEMNWCGHCTPCRNCFPNQCENLEEIGFTINGALAEYIAVNGKYCWSIDSIVDRYSGDRGKAFEVGATVEPHCVAYNSIFECAGGFRPGAYATVYGAGPIGLAAIALLKAAGAGKVIVFEISEGRRTLAEKVGADAAYDPAKVTPHEVVLDLTGGAGAEVHVEAAGAPTKTVPEMAKSMAVGGWITQIGRAAERVPMYLETFQVKKGRIFGAQGHSGYGIFPNVIRLIASGAIDPSKIITARYDLDHAVDAIVKSGTREDGKVMVRIG
ncbi:MAG: scyllo-inosose 3-dehydrogenase [Thermodesulfobacteriota bacterium]